MEYDSRKILQLLKICSWKSESTLDFSGFSILADQIDSKLRHAGENANDYVPDKKYLRQLHLDAERNLELGTTTGKHPKYIGAILYYLDFTDWEIFVSRMVAAEMAIDLTKIRASEYEQANICFFVDDEFLKNTKQNTAFAQKKLKFPFFFQKINAVDSDQIIKEIELLTSKSQFVIWGITNKWDQQLESFNESPNLREILSKGQVIPVRIGENFSKPIKRVSFNKQLRPLYGKVGFLMALAAIEGCEESVVPKGEMKKKPIGGKIHVGKFINNGTVATGDMKQENHGGNNVLGGNIIQHFPEKEE